MIIIRNAPSLLNTLRIFVRKEDVVGGNLRADAGKEILQRRQLVFRDSSLLLPKPVFESLDVDIRRDDVARLETMADGARNCLKDDIYRQRKRLQNRPEIPFAEVLSKAGIAIPAEITFKDEDDLIATFAMLDDAGRKTLFWGMEEGDRFDIVAGLKMGVVRFYEAEVAPYLTRAETFPKLRAWMVERQLKGEGITDERVLRAMGEVPREKFVTEKWLDEAYWDQPLPIRKEQPISQPYVVALMLQDLKLSGEEVVLESGTGSGYSTAVISRLCRRVYTIEIDPEAAEGARKILAELGCSNVEVVTGDIKDGLPQHAPFDRMVITHQVPEIPEVLIRQLKEGGRIVAPVGPRYAQNITTLTITGGEPKVESGTPVAFVPQSGDALNLEALRAKSYQEQVKYVNKNGPLLVGERIWEREEMAFLWPAFVNVAEAIYVKAVAAGNPLAETARKETLDPFYQKHRWDYSAVRMEDLTRERMDPELMEGAMQVRRFLIERGFPRELVSKIYLLMFFDYPRPFFLPRFYTYTGRSIYFARASLMIGGVQFPDFPFPVTTVWPGVEGYKLAVLNPKEGDKVLEIGAGSAWLAAMLSGMVGNGGQVDSVEVNPVLRQQARDKMRLFERGNVNFPLSIEAVLAGVPQDYYDQVVISSFRDVRVKIDDLASLVKPGGQLLIPVGSSPRDTRFHILTKDFQGRVLKKEGLKLEEIP